MKKSFIIFILLFISFNSNAMQGPAEKTIDPQYIINRIKHLSNYQEKSFSLSFVVDSNEKLFTSLQLIQIIIFFQKTFPNHPEIQIFENIRTILDRLSSDFLIQKFQQTSMDQLCTEFSKIANQLYDKARITPIIDQKIFFPEIFFAAQITLSDNTNPLCWATIFALENLILYLIQEKRVNPNGEEKTYIHKPDSLYFCANNGLSFSVKLLLENGACPDGANQRALVEDCSDPEHPKTSYTPYTTPLHQAVLWAPIKPEILSYLLMYHANVEILSPIRRIHIENKEYKLDGTALQWATNLGYQEAVHEIALHFNKIQDPYVPTYLPLCTLL